MATTLKNTPVLRGRQWDQSANRVQEALTEARAIADMVYTTACHDREGVILEGLDKETLPGLLSLLLKKIDEAREIQETLQSVAPERPS